MEGYAKVDMVLLGCEAVGEELERAMSVFTERAKGKGKATANADAVEGVKIEEDETAVDLVAGVDDVEKLLEAETDPEKKRALKGYLKEQPMYMAKGVTLKDYQVGLSGASNTSAKIGLTLILARPLSYSG
jgi:C4-dicarboxylate-specific signal transduction histidine kinase